MLSLLLQGLHTALKVAFILILCKVMKGLWGVYKLYPDGSNAKGYIAWGILTEAMLIVLCFIKIIV